MLRFQRITKDTRLFDGVPQQVVYIAFDDDRESLDTCAGILYHGEVICGCCGGILQIEDLLTYDQLWMLFIDEEHEGTWIDFHQVIGGACMEDIGSYIEQIDNDNDEGWDNLNQVIHHEYKLYNNYLN